MITFNNLKDSLKPLIIPAIHIILDEPSEEPCNAHLVSHFGGTPYFEKNEVWPYNDEGKPLDFIFQIFASDEVELPHSFKLIQFFYNLDEAPWTGYSDGWMVKIYDTLDLQNAITIAKPAGLRKSCFCAIKTKAIKTLPDWEGTTIWSVQAAELSKQLCPDRPWENYIKAVNELTCSYDFRSQIGGYPQWIQGNEVPFDDDGQPMELLFQIDSEDNADLMWGDMGMIYVFYDEKSDQVDFLLQSH